MSANFAGTIFDIKRYAINDGPGIRTTVFLKGCPLRCGWCHNPESQIAPVELMIRDNYCIQCQACMQACPQGAIQWMDGGTVTNRDLCSRCGACTDICYSGARELSGQNISIEELMAEIERDVPFYDQSGGGVTFSGGEPLLQHEFLLNILRQCKERDIHTTLDTSGYSSWNIMERIQPLTDLFLYDLKLINDGRHIEHTQVSNRPILSNLQELSKNGNHLIVRIPLIPGINDDADNLRGIGEFLAQLPHLDGVELMGYHEIGVEKYASLGKDYRLNEMQPPSNNSLLKASEVLESFGLSVKMNIPIA